MTFQPVLLQVAEPITRHELTGGAWLELGRGWLADGDALFERLLTGVAWRAARRPMYDRIVDVPRLTAHFEPGDAWPDPQLAELRDAVNERYAPALGEPLVSAGLCLYRDGNDSVAWHGDTIGRAKHDDTVVAIVSLGAERSLALRPVGGGRSIRLRVAHGDLVVMGGSCQRTWEHAVPKTARPVGPRISVQFRALGVR